MKFLSRLLPFTLFAPFFAFAADVANYVGVGGFITNTITFVNSKLVPAIFALAFLVFLWGMFQTFILGGSDEGAQEKGKALIMYSIAGFVVMVSLWGIVNLVANGFGFQGARIEAIPDLPVTNN